VLSHEAAFYNSELPKHNYKDPGNSQATK